MDILILIGAGILILIGIVGCFLPVLPGPPISFLGILLLQTMTNSPFDSDFLLLWGAITAAAFFLDYIIPAYGTKKYGGSQAGIIGTFAGLIAGLIFLPGIGIIIGPLVGALVGELLVGKTSRQALRAAWGSFVGFLLGTLIKLTVCVILCYHYFSVVFNYWGSV